MTGSGRRPVVLVFAAHFHPAYRAGGPVRTLRNMVAALRDEFDFRVFTRDHDLGCREPLPGVPSGEWTDVGGARVFYGSDRHRTLAAVAATIRGVAPDVVYLNSAFDPAFTIRPLLARRLGMTGRAVPWILAPRGEFAAAALRMKATKKRAFLGVARLLRLHANLVWQASSDFERDDIRRVIGAAGEVRVVPNPTAPVEPLPPDLPPPSEGVLRVCSVGRISPMKNTLFAIDVVSRLGRPVCLDLYGPLEDPGYWSACEERIASAPSGCTIAWRGEIAPDDVRRHLAGHDVMLFPSRGENFGHAIFESLAAGVPVIVSDRTPWRDLERRGSGWVRSLDDPDGFVAALVEAADRGPAARRAAAEAAHAHAAEVAGSAEVLRANRELFRAAGQGSRAGA